MISTCPDAQAWQALLKGDVLAAQHSDMCTHLEGCGACQQTLEGLVASAESWSGTARRLHEAPLDPTGKLGQVMDALKQRTQQPETLAEHGPGGDDLGYLKPSAHAQHLGRLQHYEILEVLGKGGFGTVFKAHDEALDRMVAIKVLAPQLATNATARRRFIREAKAAAGVSHDHVIGIHEIDEVGAIPYIVMQLIGGKTLQDRLDRWGPLEIKEILRIGMQIAEGLAAAHKVGLVHRDIKPANILLENGIERVKITDFGLARAIDDASLTQSGVIAGTPMFMAPEQAAGAPIDHRADLFSLGSVLYTMCTGRPPFRAPGTLAVMKRVAEEEPTPIRTINPDVPEWLCAIIARLQAKKPADRMQTAREAADLLGQHLAHLQQPERTQQPAPLPTQVPSEPPGARWAAGNRVLAPWDDDWLYPGTIAEIAEDTALVHFDDGDEARASFAELRPLAIDFGTRVACCWNRGSVFYDGILTERRGDLLHIAYDDGDREWTEIQHIRVPSGKPPHAKPLWKAAAKVAFFFFVALAFAEWRGLTNIIGFFRSDFALTLDVEEPPLDVKLFPTKDERDDQETFSFRGRALVLTADKQVTTVRLAPGNYWLIMSKGAQLVRRELIRAERGEAKIVRIGKGGKDDVSDAGKLHGTWIVKSQECDGQAAPPARWLEFARDRLRVLSADRMTEQLFAVDPTKTPKQIYVFNAATNAHEGTGIYKLENDILTLCIAKPGDARPTEFKPRNGSGDVVTVASRETSPPVIFEALQKLVALAEEEVTQVKLQVKLEREPAETLLKAEIALFEVKIRLAEAEKRPTTELARELIARHQTRLQATRERFAAGAIVQADVDRVERDLIEARLKYRMPDR